MATRKITITLDESLVDALSGIARSEGVPLSRLVAGAAERELRLRAGRAIVQDWQADHGPFTPEQLDAAWAELADADAEAMSKRRGAAVA